MTKIRIERGDITKVADIDVIVNAANRELSGGGGVDKAIHDAAGDNLARECSTLNGCDTGEAKITNAYNLACKKIIHTVGPKWEGGSNEEEELLQECYENSLNLAKDNGLKRIAFPSISTGTYKFPVSLASEIAIETVKAYIEKEPDAFDEVRFVLFDEETEKLYVSANQSPYLLLSVVIEDYNSIIDLCKKVFAKSKGGRVISKILTYIKKKEDIMGKGFEFISEVLNIGVLNKRLRQAIEKMIGTLLGEKAVRIKQLSCKKMKGKELEFSIGIGDFDYEKIFAYIIELLRKNDAKEISAIAIPAIEAVGKTLSDDIKNELIMNIINASSEGICQLAKDIVHKEMKVEINFGNLCCELKKDGIA